MKGLAKTRRHPDIRVARVKRSLMRTVNDLSSTEHSLSEQGLERAL